MRNKIILYSLIAASVIFSGCTPYHNKHHSDTAKSCSDCSACKDESCSCKTCAMKEKKCPYLKNKGQSCEDKGCCKK